MTSHPTGRISSSSLSLKEDEKLFPASFEHDGTTGLYIHIPFCVAKCRYCSFYSLPVGGWDTGAYLAAVLAQAKMMAAHAWTEGRAFQSLYVGGGTPTVCEAEGLSRLIGSCLSLFPFSDSPEVTVEANPNSLTGKTLDLLLDAGANRISIGIQSFIDRRLAALGRSHSSVDALRAVSLAREAGFTNMNIDLIHGCPDESLDDWITTLDTALSLHPEHLAMYELTIEEGTPFAKAYQEGRLALPHEETVLAMEEETLQRTMAAGYSRYEISNYALAGRESRHNVNYWENGSYIGLGAGAVSCLSGLRLRSVADPARFMAQLECGRQPFAEGEALALESSFRESVVIGMRMTKGVSISRLRGRYGLEPSAYYGEILDDFLHQGLIEISSDRLRLTEKGLPVANHVLARLV